MAIRHHPITHGRLRVLVSRENTGQLPQCSQRPILTTSFFRNRTFTAPLAETFLQDRSIAASFLREIRESARKLKEKPIPKATRRQNEAKTRQHQEKIESG